MSVYDVYRGQENEHVPEHQYYSEDEEIQDKEEEAKTLNTTNNFRRNIVREESELHPIAYSPSLNRVAESNHILYQFRYKVLWFGIIFGCLASFLAISLSIYSVMKYNEAATELQLARENRGKICLPCNDKAIQHQPWKQSSNSPGECCVSLEELLFSIRQITEDRSSVVVREALDREMAKFSTGSNVNSLTTRVSAHIGMNEMKWHSRDREELTHASAGVTLLDNGKLRVNVSGYYNIYSEMNHFYYLSKLTDESVFRHEVMMQRPDEPGDLIVLQADNMKWKSLVSKTTFNTQSSSLSGIIYITSGSTIYIRAKEIELADKQRNPFSQCTLQRCYFGLYKL